MKRLGIIISVLLILVLSFSAVYAYSEYVMLDGERVLRSTLKQDIDEADNVQQYKLGERLVIDDRVFKYACAGATLNCDMGAQIYDTQHVAYTSIAADATAGDLEIVIDEQGTDGVLGGGVIAEDELAGGYIVIFPHSSNSINRRIIANTACDGGGDEMTITLASALPVDLDVDVDHAECMASPYCDVRSLTTDTKSVIGMPTVAATVGQYLWLQTWGPCWIAPQAEVSVGSNNRNVVFRHDGSIDEYDASDANTIKAQHAGFVLANAAGAGQGAAFIMLQISP